MRPRRQTPRQPNAYWRRYFPAKVPKGRQGNLRIGYQEGQGSIAKQRHTRCKELISMGASESLLHANHVVYLQRCPPI